MPTDLIWILSILGVIVLIVVALAVTGTYQEKHPEKFPGPDGDR